MEISIDIDNIKKYGANECVLATILKEYYYDGDKSYRDNFFDNLPLSKERLFDIKDFGELEKILGEDFPIIKTFERLNELEILYYKRNNRLPGLNWHSNLTVLLDPLKI